MIITELSMDEVDKYYKGDDDMIVILLRNLFYYFKHKWKFEI